MLAPRPASQAPFTASDPARGASEKNAPDVEAAFASTPAELVAEIVDGELHTSPRPAARHARVCTRLAQRLGGFDRDASDDGPGGWVMLFGPELHLGAKPDKLVPNLAGWTRERMPELPDTAAFELAPDWVCEVLSDRTRRFDRVKKMAVYAREGVGHVWLADPAVETLEAFRLEKDRWVLVGAFVGDERVRAEPFDALELELSALWAQ